MGEVTVHVGKKIKLFRKIKNMTLEDFSKKINKSAATLSKYENGSISIDIETLFEIANALECNISQLTDYPLKNNRSSKKRTHSLFDGSNLLYMYFFDGHIKKVITSIIQLNENCENGNENISLYLNISSETFYKCEHFYIGSFKAFDTVIHFQLENQANDVEQLTINVLKPLNASSTMVGLLSGISTYLFVPTVIKVIISKSKIKNLEDVKEELQVSKEEIKNLRKMNMLALQRNRMDLPN